MKHDGQVVLGILIGLVLASVLFLLVKANHG